MDKFDSESQLGNWASEKFILSGSGKVIFNYVNPWKIKIPINIPFSKLVKS